MKEGQLNMRDLLIDDPELRQMLSRQGLDFDELFDDDKKTLPDKKKNSNYLKSKEIDTMVNLIFEQAEADCEKFLKCDPELESLFSQKDLSEKEQAESLSMQKTFLTPKKEDFLNIGLKPPPTPPPRQKKGDSINIQVEIPPVPKKKHKKIIGYIFNVILIAICIGMLSGSAAFALSNDPQKSLFGYRFYNVLSESMTPADGSPSGGFRKGDVIIVKLCDPKEIGVGDVITFVPGKDERSHLTHRVVDIRNNLNENSGLFFVTKGDANNSNDPPISASMVIGKKVMSIPMVGSIMQFIQNNFVLSIVFMFSGFGLIWILRCLVSLNREQKQYEVNIRPPQRASATM